MEGPEPLPINPRLKPQILSPIRPSWYFAVPAVHEAVLRHADELGWEPQKRLVSLVFLFRMVALGFEVLGVLSLVEGFGCVLVSAGLRREEHGKRKPVAALRNPEMPLQNS